MHRIIGAALALALLAGCAATGESPSYVAAQQQMNAAVAAMQEFVTAEAAQGHPASATETRALAGLIAANTAFQAATSGQLPTTAAALAKDMSAVVLAFGPALPAAYAALAAAAVAALNTYLAALPPSAQ